MTFSFSNCTRLALALAVFPILVRAQSAPPDTQAPPPASPKQLSDAGRDETEGNITSLVPRLLQALHYSHHPFDAEISSKFLDRYLDTLDHWHLYFLQSDLDQFEVYRTNLPVLSVRLRDFSPSTVIFSRFLQRATERSAFVTNSLHTDAFEFTNHESFIANRHTLPNPTNLGDAHRLWEEELRYEYLDEKLKESDMAVSGPASLDAQSNVVIFLPLEYTNSLSAAFLAARAKRTDESPLQNESGRVVRPYAAPPIRTVESLLPGKLLDQEHRAFGSVTTTPSNVIVRLQIPTEQALRKTTNNFYSEDGRRLGAIRFLHPADTASGTNRGIAKVPQPAQTNPLPTDTSWATNLPAPVEAGPAPALKGLVDLNRKDSEEIVNTLTKRYTGLLKNYTDLTNDDYVLEEYLTSLAHAYDPHSDYMRSDSTENFDIQMHLSLVGIGARLRSEDGDCKIEDLVPEGPAAKSGLITNEDTILAVAQKDQEPVFVTGMPLQKVVDMIRGPKGTPVALTILMAHPADPSVRQKTITLIRDVIELDDQAAKARIYQTPADSGAPPLRVGVIDLPSFYANPDTGKPGDPPSTHPTTTFKDVFRIISRFKKENVDGIILDLRRNGGGFLDQAISLTGLFARGPVVQTREPDEGPARLGSIEVSSTGKGPALYDGPLIVLTSRFSASASEIVAGALQDYGRALIVGDKATFGKGTVKWCSP